MTSECGRESLDVISHSMDFGYGGFLQDHVRGSCLCTPGDPVLGAIPHGEKQQAILRVVWFLFQFFLTPLFSQMLQKSEVKFYGLVLNCDPKSLQ